MEPLIPPCSARILMGRHVSMVPLVVFDEKMGVERGRQQQLRKNLVMSFPAVPQLMRHVDAENATRKPHRQHKPPPLPSPNLPKTGGRLPQKPTEQPILNGHHQPKQRVISLVL